MSPVLSTALDRVRSIVGPEHALRGSTVAEVYSYDASLAQGFPDAVVFPGNTAQTAAVVRLLSRAGVPVIPRGFGTNLSGGSIAVAGGVVICTARLNRIVKLCPGDRYAVVEPGVTNQELQNALSPLGWFYAPDPASQKVATIGGNIGENSGGPHCLKYGVTGNHVLGMTVVLADGKVAEFGSICPDPPGLDLRGILVGSEGALGIVTEARVRILPNSERVATLLVVYDDVAASAQTVSDILTAGIVPATLEMMDAPVMRAVEESMACGLPRDAAAVLIIEVDGPAAGLRRQIDRITAICGENGCRGVREARDAGERERLWAGRKGAFGAIARITPNYLVTDCTVPRNRLPEALARVAQIARSHGLASGNVFHAGDGNLHPLLFFDSRDKGQLERVHRAGWEIMEACVDLGGTISGEHGIGVEKKEAMRMIASETDLAFQRSVKRAFDPAGRLNPGKVLPPQQPWDVPPPPGDVSAELTPGSTLLPADAAEAARLVRAAAGQGIRLIPVGNDTSGKARPTDMEDGGTAFLNSTALRRVIEFDATNQVVTTEAGVMLCRLQKILAEQEQWVPLRPPAADRCTVGGMVASGSCGPDRLRYGAPRDLLLGMKFISPSGFPVAAGGKVVKNVSGFDVTRLLTGSEGTLGFLTELTFRTLPLPEKCALVAASGSVSACARVAGHLLASCLEPVFVTATATDRGAAGDELRCRFAVGFEGFAETVSWQTGEALRQVTEIGLSDPAVVSYEPGKPFPAERVPPLADLPVVLRAAVPLGSVQAYAERIASPAACDPLFLDFGCGRIHAGLPSALDEERRHSLVEPARSLGGHAWITAGAPDSSVDRIRSQLSPSVRRLTDRLWSVVDPCHVFTPSAFPEGVHG